MTVRYIELDDKKAKTESAFDIIGAADTTMLIAYKTFAQTIICSDDYKTKVTECSHLMKTSTVLQPTVLLFGLERLIQLLSVLGIDLPFFQDVLVHCRA